MAESQKESKRIIKLNMPTKRFSIRFSNGGSSDIIPNKYGLIHLDSNSHVVFRGDTQFSAGCSLRVHGKVEFMGKFELENK